MLFSDFDMTDQKSADAKRDEIIKRMLATPPQPRKKPQVKKAPAKRKSHKPQDTKA